VNTKLLLSASAIVMGAAGIAGTFAPDEIAESIFLRPQAGLAVVIQLLAALLFAFAMTNWFARGNLLGGIYSRPLAIGNLTHFLVGGLALARFIIAGERRVVFLIATAVYVVFAAGFAAALSTSPVRASREI
jgi:uncharacterized integral membrane protein